MMVSDNDIYSLFFCKRDRINRSRTDVNGDDEFHSPLRKRRNCFRMKSVPFPVAVRQVNLEIRVLYFVEKVGKQRRTRDAVAIKIRVHRNTLVLFYKIEFSNFEVYLPH